jgi:transposase
VQRELWAAGLPIVVVETRHMRNMLGAMRNKTDHNDARRIAQMVRLGWFRAVHVKSRKLRTLLANRKLLKRKPIDLENHIRGAIRTYGLRIGRASRKTFETRIRERLGSADAVFEVMISTMLAVRRSLSWSLEVSM